MNARIEKAVNAVRSSYWFVPSLMTLAAIALAAFMVWLDVKTGNDWLNRHLGWYQSIKPSGARDVLSTIAGSTLTVAGTAFSVTIAAISFASGQFGPRLLTNFMEDRGNTITLGTFVATFVYCLFVLRTVRESEDGGFVPQLAVAVGMLLALCSVAVLIYFIHHVPRLIHVNGVIASIGRQLIAGIDESFPSRIGSSAAEEPAERQPVIPSDPPASIRAHANGYVQVLDEGDLLSCAEDHGLLLRLYHRPGDFVASGRPLLDAWPAQAADEEVCNNLRQAFAIGDGRTPAGDLNFLFNELVEIAVRALSTGVNDPMTAVASLDWLGAALSELAGREIPDPLRADKGGTIRVIAIPDQFSTYVEQSLGRLRQHVARDAIAAAHTMRTIGLVASGCAAAGQVRTLNVERERLLDSVRRELAGASLAEIEQLSERLQVMLAAGPGRIDERNAAWLGGSA